MKDAEAATRAANIASSAETRVDMLAHSGAGYTLIRKSIAQVDDGHGGTRPGVLGTMVTQRKRRALQLYLLLLTIWPWLEKQPRPLPADVWARALRTDKGRHWTASNVSTAWRELETLNLVTRKLVAGGLRVVPLREDGGGEPYRRPSGASARSENYFTLPPEFWTQEYFESLSLPALAMLLVIASRTTKADAPDTWLVRHDAAGWYGLSERSVDDGLGRLEAAGLLMVGSVWVKAPLSRIGTTQQLHYGLRGEFSTESRLGMQGEAKAARLARVAASAAPGTATEAPPDTGLPAADDAAEARPASRGGRKTLRRRSLPRTVDTSAATGLS